MTERQGGEGGGGLKVKEREGVGARGKRGSIEMGIKLIFFFFFGKTYFEVSVLLLFSTFRPCTFILRHCILILLFSYRFCLSVRAR